MSGRQSRKTPGEGSEQPVPIDSGRWRRLSGIVEVALGLDRSTRAVYLETLGRLDEDLHERVLSILRSVGAEDVGDASSKAPAAAPADEDHLGPWRLGRLLGRGGMGSVYLAERDDAEYERRAAIKVIGDGFQAPSIYRRFLAERQILAAFDHPHIAKLYDAGTARDGRPYLVMEYVEGEPVHRYCFDRDLSLVERLELFRKICSAVIYAHRQLVVHRDLKPTNILVGADGEPKLLDFGIAKLLEPESLVPFELEKTPTTQAVMTPKWASPEQLRREAISTSSDVYSLGLLLFYLLAGCLPPRGLHALMGAPEGISPRPSRLLETEIESETEQAWSKPLAAARLVRGDLDNIVMKALRPEAEKRYPSVEAFDEDVERFLDGRPVSATRDTPLYLLRKTVGRYRWQVVAATLFVLSILSTAGVALWQAEKVRQERDRAADQARRAEGSLSFLADLLQAADESERTREDLSVRELLVEALDRIEAGAVEAPEAEVDLLELIADALFDARDLPSTIRALELAHRTAVERGLSQARGNALLAEVAEMRILANDPANLGETCETLIATADRADPLFERCYDALEFLTIQRGDLRELSRLKAWQIARASADRLPEALVSLHSLDWLEGVGLIESRRAAALLRDVGRVAIRELSAEEARDVLVEVSVALIKIHLALEEPEIAAPIAAWLAENSPAAHRHDTLEGNILYRRAELALQLGRHTEALQLIDRAEAVARDMLEIDPADLRARYLIARVPSSRALVWHELGLEERQRQALEEAVKRIRRLAEQSGENFLVMREYVHILLLAGHVDEARPIVRDLLEKGYRYHRFMRLAEENGLLPDPLPPPVAFELTLPPDLQELLDASRRTPLPWE